jgi:hypothetical protein
VAFSMPYSSKVQQRPRAEPPPEVVGSERIPSPHGLARHSPERAMGSFARFDTCGGSVQ